MGEVMEETEEEQAGSHMMVSGDKITAFGNLIAGF